MLSPTITPSGSGGRIDSNKTSINPPKGPKETMISTT